MTMYICCRTRRDLEAYFSQFQRAATPSDRDPGKTGGDQENTDPHSTSPSSNTRSKKGPPSLCSTPSTRLKATRIRLIL